MAVDFATLFRRLQAGQPPYTTSSPYTPGPGQPGWINPDWGPGNEPGGLTRAQDTTSTPDTTNDPGGTWNVPDYGALLAQFMAPLDAQYQAQNTANLASRNAGFRRAAIQFGELPNVSQIAQALGLSQSDLADVFGSDTGRLAQGNTQAGTSTVARLNQTHQDAVRGITNALASRGLLHSGETGFQQGRENQNYTNAQYDARNKLLDYLSGLQSGYASAAQQAAAAEAQARMNAAMQIQGLYQPTFTPNQTAGWNPQTAPYGLDSTGKPVDLSGVFNAFPYTAPPRPAGMRRGPFGHQPA